MSNTNERLKRFWKNFKPSTRPGRAEGENVETGLVSRSLIVYETARNGDIHITVDSAMCHCHSQYIVVRDGMPLKSILPRHIGNRLVFQEGPVAPWMIEAALERCRIMGIDPPL